MDDNVRPEGSKGFAVVFDFDGTLIDSKHVKVRSYVKAFERIFKTGRDDQRVVTQTCQKNLGANRFVQLAETLKALDMSATEEQKEAWSLLYSDLNREALSSIPEFPSVRSTLRRLSRRGVALFAASGILGEEFIELLKGRNLSQFFLEVRGGDKSAFLSGLKERGYGPILFVGDTPYDRKTAEQAGVSFFQIDTDRDIRRLSEQLASPGT